MHVHHALPESVQQPTGAPPPISPSLPPSAHAASPCATAGYQPKVTSYEGLMSLAKSQGLANNANRGACKICGGLGHLTKQCRNGVSGHAGTLDDLEMAAHQGTHARTHACGAAAWYMWQGRGRGGA